MQFITIFLFSFIPSVLSVYFCYTNSNCQFQSPSEVISSDIIDCCEIGAYSYATDVDGNNCTLCHYVINITITPTQSSYTANILYAPNGGQLILTFPVEINAFYSAVTPNATLPTVPPHESILVLTYSEGTGEALEYSRITPASGSLHGGLINRDTYTNTDIPTGKFIPVVRDESYNGTIMIEATYIFKKVQREVSYSFVVLECLECLNGGYPNLECSQCVCTDGYTGKLCQNTFNTSTTVCSNTTCLNKGDCSISEENMIECGCVTGFNGDFCQFDVDECLLETHNCTGSSQCQNLYGTFTCICNEGLTGANCDVIIHPCSVILCTSHALCIVQDGQALCVCDEGYTGVACLTLISACDSGNCSVNTSVCIDSVPGSSEYTCVCSSGFEGEFCTQDVDECVNLPCLSSETCINTFGGYTCVCEVGNCGVITDYVDWSVYIGLGIALIIIVIVIGVIVIVFWVILLVIQYLRKVRLSARYLMIKKFEKERQQAKRSSKKSKKRKERVQEIEMTAAIFDNTYRNDILGEDDIITTL